MAFIDKRTGMAFGKITIFGPMSAGPWKGLQQLKLLPVKKGVKLTLAQRRHLALMAHFAERFSELPLELIGDWINWAYKNSHAAHLMEKEMEVSRHYMERRKARRKIDGESAYVMCCMAAYYAGLPLSDKQPLLHDPTKRATDFEITYILNEEYPDGAVAVTFTDPTEVRDGTKKAYRARLFLHFSGARYRISRQLIGYIELPNNGKPLIISELRGQGRLGEKMVKLSKLGKGWMYGIVDTVAKNGERAAVPALYTNPARVRINKDPEGLAKSDKKYTKFKEKFPPPKKLN